MSTSSVRSPNDAAMRPAVIYGNARVVPSIGWCCTDKDGNLITDADDHYIVADPGTGFPKHDQPPRCPTCGVIRKAKQS